MNQLFTTWGKKLETSNVLQEYPRPQLERNSYFNLNGFWDYAITDNPDQDEYDGKILVPFSPEATLSQVNRTLRPSDYLIYHKIVILPIDFIQDKLLLHFGAVDQEAKVYINDKFVGSHLGGYTPFSFNISEFILSNQFSIKVIVKDISDTSDRQTGKQRSKSGGIFYTSQSGIWQTVWLESVPKNYISNIKLIPRYDDKSIEIHVLTNSKTIEFPVEIKLYYKKELKLEIKSQKSFIILPIDDFYAWTPDTPNIYDIEILYDEDKIKSYFGMRKFERKEDKNKIMRFYLNNEPYFLSGVLDQGYFPDGLLTNPSDDALIFDIKRIKEMGFNLLRKHIKVEPLRWYYHCDRLGMIVWQDMVSGSERKDIFLHGFFATLGININDKFYRLFGRKSEKGRNQFLIELKETIEHLKNCTCISTWVPFNEAWGQFDSLKAEKIIRQLDSSRLIDHASGWSDQKGGDYCSRHIYFTKIKFSKAKAKKRILALTEFGGFSFVVENHCYNPERVFGYKKYHNKEDLMKGIQELYSKQILPEVKKGLSVLIYTQLSDVEDEVNGFVSYDRQIQKVDCQVIKNLNNQINLVFHESLK
ncbi:MAG: glycoside hydrolase family 2 [Firmicutes bacterium]|nr:glycoside hydrolase family 2 [Bacillota bacterium]